MRRLFLFAVIGCALALGACDGSAKTSADNLAAGQAYLAANAKRPGVVTLPDGLQYRILHSGPADGLHPRKGDDVKVNYEVKLVSGKVVESSFETGQPMARPLNDLVPAWMEALPMMRPGDEWELVVPAKLGYGEQDMGDIPPNSVLIFRIQMLGVLPATQGVAQG